jgi:hypothetical protein
MTVRKTKNGRGRLRGMWLPQGTLDDGILWITNEDEPTKAQRAPDRRYQQEQGCHFDPLPKARVECSRR